MIVVDASVIAPVVADSGAAGTRLRDRIRSETLAAPDLLRVEVLSVIRRQIHLQTLTNAQADAAVDDLLDLPVEVFPTEPFLHRMWQLRGNVTVYDAAYVTVAESLDCILLTSDQRLARAPGPTCIIETV